MSQFPPGPPPGSAPPPPGQPPGGWGAQPQYQGQPQYPGQPQKSGGGGKVVLLVAVVAVVVVGAAVLLTRDSSGSDSPVGTVEAFYDAAAAGDCEAVVDLVSQATIQQEGGSREAAIASCETDVVGEVWPDGTSLDFEVASQDDDSAIVNVEATIEGETITLPLGMVVEDGGWKVDATSTPDSTATAESETVVPDEVEDTTGIGGP